MSATHPQPKKTGVPHWAFLTAFYLTGVFWGIRSVRYWEPSLLDLAVPLVTCLVLSWWAVLDSRDRGHPIPLSSGWLFFIFAGILVPSYMIWSRRWYGAGLVAIHATAWYGLYLLAMFVGRMIAFGVPFGQ